MTISSTANRNDYTGNDTTATYAYSFRVFLSSDFIVTVRNTTTDVESTLALTTDYTVTDVGVAAGGSIVLAGTGKAWQGTGSFLNSGYEMTIRRVVGLTQITDIRNQGDFFPEIHEDVFDKSLMIDQQQQDELDRSAKLPETVAASSFDPTLPADIVGEDGLTVITNPAGTAFIAGPSAASITGASDSAAAAAASAAAALVSENAAAADAVLTAADLVQTNLDQISCDADATATAADLVQTNLDQISCDADATQVAADLVQTNLDQISCAADAASTAQDAIDTAADAVSTAADAVTTAGHAAAVTTHAGLTATHGISGAILGTTDTQTITNKTFDDELRLKEIATPGSAAAGYQDLFVDSADNKMKRIDENGDVFGLGGGAGDANTVHLYRAADQGSSDFTIKSIDDVLPDFGGSDTLTATFEVASSGTDALLSNDDAAKVFKFSSTTASQYDAVGIVLAIPAAHRGKDILQSELYRTADTSGASANGDYMKYIVDKTNMVNTTTTSTGAQAAGTSLTVGTSTGMAVGDRIMIGTATGLVDTHVTAIADSTHCALADDVTLTSGDRFVTGILTDSLTTYNAADSDTNKIGTDFKKYVLIPETCAEIVVMWQQLTTETDSFLFFDNVLISADPFQKVDTQGERISVLGAGNGGTSITAGSTAIDFTEVTDTHNAWDGTTYTVQDNKSIVDIHTSVTFTGGSSNRYLKLFKNGSFYKIIGESGVTSTTHYGSYRSAEGEFSAGDTLTLISEVTGGTLNNTSTFHHISIEETPQKGTAIIVESADSVISDLTEETLTVSAVTTAPTKGTITRDSVQSTRVGSYLHIEVDYIQLLAGSAVGSGAYLFSIPNGLSADTTKISTSTDLTINSDKANTRIGGGSLSQLAAARGIVSAHMYNSTQYVLKFDAYTGDSTVANPTNENEIGEFFASSVGVGFDDNLAIRLSLRVPIAGWSAVNKPLLAIPTVDYSWQNEFSARVASGGSVSSQSGNLISGAVSNPSGGNYTLTFAETFNEIPSVIIQADDDDRICYKTTVSTTQVIYQIVNIGDTLLNASHHIHVQRQGGDYRSSGNQAAIISAPSVILEDQKASGSTGGTSTTTTVHTRVLNTLFGDIAAVGVTLSSNQFTLPAGKYEIEATAPAHRSDRNQLFLHDGTSYIKDGQCAFSANADTTTVHASIKALVTITSSTTYELRHWIETGATNGLGVAADSGATNPQTTEVFAQVKITRKA